MLKIFRLLKPEVKTFEVMVSQSYRMQQHKDSIRLLRLIALKKFKVSMEALEHLAFSLIYHYKRKNRPLNVKKYGKINVLI